MAYTTINKPTDYFNTKLYTGNGSTNAITGVGFQPDWVSIKRRSGGAANGGVFDALRGVTKLISTSTNDAEQTRADSLTAFGTDGFTLGADSGNYVNGNSQTFVSWNWKAGTTGSGTTTGSGYGKAYSYSVSTTAGFSIVKYKGNGTAGHTIPHHLGTTPSLIFVKNLDAAQSWLVGNTHLGWTRNLHLNESGVIETTSNIWNDTAPTSTVFTVGTNSKCNTDDADYIAYVFAEITGYSKWGKYYGTNSTDGAFLYTGFKPALMILKRLDGQANSWLILDNKRDTDNLVENYLFPSESDAEGNGSGSQGWDFLSNGIKQINTYGSANQAANYFFIAFAETPLVGTNNIPCTAR